MKDFKEQKYTCQYCNKTCFKQNREKKRYWWWECSSCNTHFLVSIKGSLSVIEFKTPDENEKFYTLHVMLQHKCTDIFVWTPDTYSYDDTVKGYNRDLVKRFDKVLDVTPENFQNKIKTVLTFL